MEKKEKPSRKQLKGTTQDEQLLESPRPDEFKHTDPWRVFRIMGEFVEGFDELATLSRGIAIFGSARTRPDDPDYQAAQETGALLAAQGFAVITGGGPGIMEAANRGAFEAPIIVNAAGAWGGQIATLLGETVPVEAAVPIERCGEARQRELVDVVVELLLADPLGQAAGFGDAVDEALRTGAIVRDRRGAEPEPRP